MRGHIRRVLTHPAVAGALLCHLVFVLVVALDLWGFLERLDLIAYDQGVRWRADLETRDARITVVGVTEEDLGRYGWPLSDGVLADAIARLIDLGALAVAVDLYRDHPVAPGSERLDALLHSQHRIVWVYRFADAGRPETPPPAALAGTDRVGFADLTIDRDGVTRRALLFLDDAAGPAASLALVMAHRYLRPRGIEPEAEPGLPRAMRLGAAVFVPLEANDGGYRGVDARGFQILMDYALGAHPFETPTLADLLDGPVARSSVEGRLVFIGAATETVKDFVYTPFSSAGRFNSTTHGVVLQAIITSQLLRNALDGTPPTITLSQAHEIVWIWLWCLLGGLWGYFAPSTARFALVTAGGLGLLGGLWYAGLAAAYLWTPLLPAALGWIGSAALLMAYTTQRERAARQTLLRLFARYVPAAVVEELWQQRDAILEGGRPRPQMLTATVLVSDIEDFTRIAEPLDPKTVMDWLNLCLERMIQAVTEHGGVILHATGETLLAVFGAPLPRRSEDEVERDAVHAIDCALAIARHLTSLNQQLRAQDLQPVTLRLGITTGPIMAGSLGSAERMEYAAIGDTVNTAQRLQGMAKEFPKLTGVEGPCLIAVGEATWQRLKDAYLGYPVGEMNLRGKEQRLNVYQLFCTGNQIMAPRSAARTTP